MCAFENGKVDRFFLTAGQKHDVTQAKLLTEHLSGGSSVVADKGYDSNSFRLNLLNNEIEPVIPSRKNRIYRPPYDKEKYKYRYRIECLFNRLKQNRGFSTRFEKLARSYLGGVAFLCVNLSIEEAIKI